MKFSWWKLIVGFLLYLFFHQAYDLLPGALGFIFGEGFGSIYARMLILATVPWMMIVIYYAVEAVGIVLPHAVDITWAILVTVIGLYFCIRLEEPFENMPLRGSVKAMIVLAFATALITYVGFSFSVPDNFFITVH